MYIKVNRRNRPSCIVMLCRDRTTKKWCFVNLSTEHVCTCRFDTIDAAFADLREREEVVSYFVIENPFVRHLTANAFTTLFSTMPDIVERFGKAGESIQRLLWAGEDEKQ